ncbi:spore germination protein [Peribacillus sp. B-H-3]|uniref:spore germination protein n=1 Tax=Peribacillus sp. B-H-3 TaxID=3400420 RepID=UPI003B029EBB
MKKTMEKESKVISTLKRKFNESKDFIIHEFQYYENGIVLVYLKSMCDEEKIRKEIIQPLMMCEKESKFVLHLLSLPGSVKITDQENIENKLLRGNTVIFISGSVYALSEVKTVNVDPLETMVETSVQGPQKGLSEELYTNITMIRNRYPTSELMVEHHTAGTLSKTPIALMYDVSYVQEDVLNQLKNSLAEIDMDMIQSAGQLQNALTKKKYRLFPTIMITERPDRIALCLSQGKVALLVNGTPFGLVLPSVFFDFISAMDDLSHTYWVAQLMIILRYIGLIITLVLPALYVAITSYNPEILRSQLTLTIAGSREAVPYPSFFEVIFMMLVVEMLVESSIRLPKAIGPTATTVGGLILGQAAQQAQLVSSIMIIITAFVAISNFTIPINAMSFAIRVARYPLILFASLFGFVGLIAGFVILLCYLIDLRSFGKPYLAIYGGSNRHIMEIIESKKEDSR